MGENRIGITAQMAALIRAERKIDQHSQYFVTPRVRRIYRVANFILPRTVKRVFDKRAQLSKEIQQFLLDYAPEQVIELASGSSVMGFEYSQSHPHAIYVETDLPSVIAQKESIIEQILKAETSEPNPNHILLPADVLADNLSEKVRGAIKKRKRTLVIAQGLTSYFDETEYSKYIQNVSRLLDSLDGGAYLSHETIGEKMTSGLGGKILRGIVTILAGRKSHQHFHSAEELRSWYHERGFREVRHLNGKSGSYVFLMSQHL